MEGTDRAVGENMCPKCGADAEWSYPDAEKIRVDIKCSTCGSFGMIRAECREALAEMEAEDEETRTPG